MKIGNIFTTVAKTQTAQKIYKRVLDPKHDKFMNTQLPVIESAVISGMYIFSTAIQKNIDPDSKEALQWQNILSLLFSVGMAIPLNKKVAKIGDNIIKHLKPELIEDGHKVVDGIKVGLPILNSILISRFLVAVGLVPLSSKIREAIKERHAKKENLNVIA